MDLGGLVLVPMMTFATPLHTSHTHNRHQRFQHVSGLGLEMSWNTPHDEHSHDDTCKGIVEKSGAIHIVNCKQTETEEHNR